MPIRSTLRVLSLLGLVGLAACAAQGPESINPGAAGTGSSTGAAGTTGAAGSTSAGAAGTGVNPDTGAAGTSSATGAAGTSVTTGTGAAGTSGAAGTTGSAGTTGAAGTTAPPPPPGGRRVVGYFTAWGIYARNYQPTSIPAAKLTHLNYAFANVTNGECVLGDSYADIDKFFPGDTWDAGALRGNFHQLQVLKAANPNLRTLISVGGWTWSANFSDAAATDAGRVKLASSCVAFMKKYGFDGVDIDWEYPVGGGLVAGKPADKQNYTLLLREFRKQLDALGATDGRPYLLTIAAPAGPTIVANLEVAAVGAAVDWINLMAYDFHGGWELATNFNAPMSATATDPSTDPVIRSGFNVGSAVNLYLSAGVPAAKLVLGVPFYGHGWAGVPAANDGLYQKATSIPTGTWEAGKFDYKDLAANYLSKYTRRWHDEAQVPWLYNPQTGIMITYDDPQSLGVKVDLVKSRGLGGVMFWELSGDDAKNTLLDAINARLK